MSGETLYVHGDNVNEMFDIIYRCYGGEIRRLNMVPKALAMQEFGYDLNPPKQEPLFRGGKWPSSFN